MSSSSTEDLSSSTMKATLRAFSIFNIEIPSVKAKNVIEGFGNAFSQNVSKLLVPRPWTSAEFVSKGFCCQEFVDADWLASMIKQ